MLRSMHATNGTLYSAQLNGNAKPVPPPRDHLRVEKDGRLVNCSPAPQLPDRRAPGNASSGSSGATTHPLQHQQIAQIVEPTLEQLDSIKKYQVSGMPLKLYAICARIPMVRLQKLSHSQTVPRI